MAVLQMTWQQSLLNQKRKSGPPLGLKNLGNTCYLNSVLQCLTYTPPLANFCLRYQHSSSCDSADAATEKKRECPFCLLEKRIARSLSIDCSLDAPAKINSCLRIFSEHFTRGRQEDAHEFLRYVIDACHNTCLRLKKLQLQRRKGGNVSDNGSGNTIVKEIFGGALQSQVKCLSCGSESNKVDEIMDISLDILHSGSLKDALQRFFQPETLDGNNKYKCDNCKKLVVARKQMSILQAPNVLVIQLKRFEGIFGGKIDKAIAFEEVLVLSSYMCRESQDLHPEYKLFGTIVHSGFSPDSGHYYAYIKDAMGRWYCCNDSYVSLSTLQEVVSEKVYILFFTRSKQRPPIVKAGLLTNGSKCHQANGADASKDVKSGQLEKPMNTKALPDHHSASSNSISSKIEKVPSGPSRKLAAFENSDIRKPHTNGSIKIIVHKKEPLEKTCNPTSSSDAEGNQKNVHILTDMNGASKVRLADAIDPGKSNYSTITNGNGKIQHVSADLLDRGLCEDDSSKDNMSTGRTPEHRELSNGDVKCHSDSFELKRKSHDKDPSILLAKDATTGKTPEHRELSNGDVKSHSDSSGLERKSQDKDPSSLLAKDETTGRTPEHKQLSYGDVKRYSDSSGLKRKTQDKDPSVLLDKDARSRTKVEEFKKVIGKEASLALRSCGWYDEVYNFMRSRKKICIGEGKYDTSDINETKRLLMADAKSAFLSKVPESLKGSLVERLVLFSQQKRSSGT